jgi:hypothetical protein
MCSYLTERSVLTGSAKGPSGWFPVTHATVYFDHPYHAPFEHTLNIDFANDDRGPSSRVAVEMTAESARELVRLINASLAAADAAGAISEPPAYAASGGEDLG